MSLEIFGFRALWSPFFFISLVVVSVLFFLAATKFREKLSNDSEPLTNKQATLFLTSIITLYIIKGSPVDLLGHIMFSAHMTQMAILYLVIPPLLILAIPHWMWRSFLSLRLVNGVFGLMTKPLIALIVFNSVFSIYHIPLVFDFVKTDMWVHAIYTVLLFVTAMFMWWPLVNNLEEYQELYGIKRIGYVFANGILLTPACGLIIFADTPMYNTFSNPAAWAQALELCVPSSTLQGITLSGPEMFNWLSLHEDQRTGGVIMKIIQEIVFGFVLAYIFFGWYRSEGEKVDPLPEVQPAE